MSKETYIREKSLIIETSVSQGTFTHVKRDLYTCQKRPIYNSKETYIHEKSLIIETSVSKETCIREKRPEKKQKCVR